MITKFSGEVKKAKVTKSPRCRQPKTSNLHQPSPKGLIKATKNQKPGPGPPTHAMQAPTHQGGSALGLFLAFPVERVLAHQLMQATKDALEVLSTRSNKQNRLLEKMRKERQSGGYSFYFLGVVGIFVS
jgi:hypothetical protein